MVQPVSVGWVFLKILETLWRSVVLVVLAAAFISSGVWLSERNPLESNIRLTLNRDDANCTDRTHPLHVVLENESKKTLGEVDLRFRVYRQGNSRNLAQFATSTRELHDILRPGYWNAYCFAMPELEPGSTGPYLLAADVVYASELSKDVPTAVATDPPAPVIQTTPVIQPVIITPRATDSVAPRPWWSKIADIVFALLALGLFASGGGALIVVSDRLLNVRLMNRLNSPGNDRAWIIVLAAAFANMLLVDFASILLTNAGLGGWIANLDAWSRSHGFADGGLILLTAVACQWPWAIFLALPHQERPADQPEKGARPD